MNRVIALGVVLIVAVAGFLIMMPATPSLAELQPGDAAPPFSLSSESGETVSLSDFKGRTVVLEWINPDCPFVKRHAEAGTMRALAEKFAPDVVWIAINSSKQGTTEGNLGWREKNTLPYPVLDDRTGKVGRAYGARTTPHMFVVDAEQKVVYNGAIDSDPYGDASSKVSYVEQALTELREGAKVKTAQTEPYGCSVKYAT